MSDHIASYRSAASLFMRQKFAAFASDCSIFTAIGLMSTGIGVMFASLCLTASIVHADTGNKLDTKLQALGYDVGESIERIEHYRVNGWNYVDDQHIVVYAGPSQRYLISTLNYCRDLSSTENIGFTTTSSSLTKFDKLIVRGAGGIVQHCPLTEIKTLIKRDDKH